MPFGLRNAGQTFQRTMDAVLRGLDNVFVYIDDILIASHDVEEHKEDLHKVLKRLQEHGLLIRPDKCEFGKKSINFLGHNISPEGIRPLPGRVESLKKYPLPQTPKQLRTFLGVINYYHRFIPMAAAVLRPLHRLSQQKPAHCTIKWTKEEEKAFNEARGLLCNSTLLTFPAVDGILALCTDASEVGIGAALEQWATDHWEPLGFFSRGLSKSQTKYSTFDRELLAAHLAAQHFSHSLDGRQCILVTDHKPLIHAWKRTGDP